MVLLELNHKIRRKKIKIHQLSIHGKKPNKDSEIAKILTKEHFVKASILKFSIGNIFRSSAN